jgi:hypothetical protein
VKKPLLALVALCAVTGIALLATAPTKRINAVPESSGAFVIEKQDKNPWTSLTPNADPEQFQFAIVSDRTGAHRKGVFTRAIQQINLMQPEFIVSVGDLIEGSAAVAATNKTQWTEFEGFLTKLDNIPFFYTPGNHDAAGLAKAEVWKERYGRRYYHFVYKNCLFLILNAYDDEGLDPTKNTSYTAMRVGPAQQEYVAKALKENPNVTWTFAFIHPPIWAEKDLVKNGWGKMEESFAGRKMTVYCGHRHIYRKYVRNGINYYQLATTGGGSSMRGAEYGEFDQIAWMTVKKTGPVMANINLGGVYKDDLEEFPTVEDGKGVTPAKDALAVRGQVLIDGKPPANGSRLQVNFLTATGATSAGNSRLDAEGRFSIYPNRGGAGIKAGKYLVTVSLADPLVVDPEVKLENPIPEKYRAKATTPFEIEVTATGENAFKFEIKTKE